MSIPIWSQWGLAGFWLVVFWPFLSHAAANQTCLYNQPSRLFLQIKKNHPEGRVLEASKEISLRQISQAAQRPNPVFSFATQHGAQSMESSVSLQHVIELAGKRLARIKYARANKAWQETKIQSELEGLLIDAIWGMSRLTQIEELLDLYKESIRIFAQTRNTRRANRRLSPEQKLEKDILDIEVGKHRLRIAQLQTEKEALSNILKLYSGKGCTISFRKLEIDFPSPQKFEGKSLVLPEYREQIQEKHLFEARWDLEESQAISDLKVGPTLQWAKDSTSEEQRIGITLSMELPILSKNEGGIATAKARYVASQIRNKEQEAKNRIVVSSKIHSYRHLRAALGQTPSREDLIDKHHRIEKYFARGIISVSSMLEGHDQFLGSLEKRNSMELDVLRILLELEQASGSLDSFLDKWSRK